MVSGVASREGPVWKLFQPHSLGTRQRVTLISVFCSVHCQAVLVLMFSGDVEVLP